MVRHYGIHRVKAGSRIETGIAVSARPSWSYRRLVRRTDRFARFLRVRFACARSPRIQCKLTAEENEGADFDRLTVWPDGTRRSFRGKQPVFHATSLWWID
jgi:hypothetical protein